MKQKVLDQCINAPPPAHTIARIFRLEFSGLIWLKIQGAQLDA